MTMYSIKMPDIGEGIAEVELVAWRVQSGDTVTQDQVVADVMTDKATVEIPSPVAGKVGALEHKAGDLIPVGAVLIALELGDKNGASHTEANKGESPLAAAPAAAAPAIAHAEKPPTRWTQQTELAPEGGAAIIPLPSARAPQPGERPLASPSVRNRAWDLGIELRFVAGSGPAGRITHEDLDTYVQAGANAPMRAAAHTRPAREGTQVVPLTGLRRRIADKMQLSKREIPHFSYVEEVDVTELEDAREALNATYAKTRGKLTVLPFIARAVVLTLPEFPQLNATFDNDTRQLTQTAAVHLGIAAQTDAGLMVPVLRHAETHDIWSFSAELSRLADAARSGKASRAELAGSTITISSLGALGGIVSTPVINHPEVAIIGVNRIIERPMLRAGTVVARKLMNLSSSFDHRVVDGVVAAQFVQRVRTLLEQPTLLFAG